MAQVARPRVLVVEDNHKTARNLSLLLEAMGYEVPACVHGGLEAIEQADVHRPDLILMDIMLEGPCSGIDAAEIIRRRFHTPVVYLTAFADSVTINWAKLAEPYGYLVKPFTEDALKCAIEVALYRYQLDEKHRREERWMALALEGVEDGIIVTDERGHVVVMNTRSQEMTGLHEAHTIGAAAHEVVELVSGATRQPVKIPVEEALRERIPLHLHEQLWVVASDGRMAPVSCTITPVEDPGAGLQGSVVVLHPVDTH